MAVGSNSKPVHLCCLVPILFAVIIFFAGGCASPKSETTGDTAKKYKVEAVADRAINNLGSEKEAFMAILSAWDEGYSLGQIITGINDDRLSSDGKIRGVSPKNKPQNQLKASKRVPLIAMAGAPGAEILAGVPTDAEINERFESRKGIWTVWILGVVAAGYSVEQITDYMIANERPALAMPGYYPVITEQKKDPKTGEIKNEYVKPAFPPEWILTEPKGVDKSDAFLEDLGKDFEKLVEGKGTSAEKGKFKPATFSFDLKIKGNSGQRIRSAKVTLKIDSKGFVTGDYSADLVSEQSYQTTEFYETGTLKGQAVYPKAKGGMIYMDLKVTGHFKKVRTSQIKDIPTKTEEEDYNSGFGGNFSTDYTEGKGTMLGKAAFYEFELGLIYEH